MHYLSNYMKYDQKTVIFSGTQSGKNFEDFFLLIETIGSVLLLQYFE